MGEGGTDWERGETRSSLDLVRVSVGSKRLLLTAFD